MAVGAIERANRRFGRGRGRREERLLEKIRLADDYGEGAVNLP